MKRTIDWPRFIQLYPSYLYDEIFVHNEYQVFEEDIVGKTVLDLGANVGMFSAKCIELGAKQIVAVEGQASIYKNGLLFNMAQYYPLVVPMHNAVAASDDEMVYLPDNFVASKISHVGDPVRTITLTSLLALVKNDENVILKIDIEGAEYEVIHTTNPDTLRQCEFIHMELHPNGSSSSMYDLRNKLWCAGFEQAHSIWCGSGCEIDKWRRK